MKYYAADNSYATATSMGFCNTWEVLVFDSRAARDTFVRESDSMATRAIKRRDIRKYLNGRRPMPFSTECYVIDAWQQIYGDRAIPGCLGAIVVEPGDLLYSHQTRLNQR